MMRSILTPFGLKPKKVTGPRYGDVNDRTMAAAIDVFLLYLILGGVSQYVSTKVFAAYGMQMPGFDTHAQNFAAIKQMLWQVRWPWLISNLLIVLLMGVIIVACQLAYRTTPGKWLIGLKIVREGTFEQPTRWRYVLRFFGYLVSCAPLMLGIIWMSFNRKRRGFHDYIAGTVVISTRPQGWYWQQLKRGYRKLRGLPEPLPVEQSVREPAAAQGHGDSDQTV